MHDDGRTREELLAEIEALRSHLAQLQGADDARARLLFDTANAAVLHLDLDGRVLGANRHALEMWGGSAGGLVGRSLTEVMPDIARQKLPLFAEAAATGASLVSEDFIPLPDGAHWFSTSINPVGGDGGKPATVQLVAFDISRRKRAEQDLETNRERFRRLFATMTQGVVYQDEGGTITSANPAAERILGLSLDQMQGRTSVDPRWRSIREDGADLPGEEHPSMVALRTGRAVSGAIMGVYHPEKDEMRWLRVDAVPQFRPGASRPFEVYALFEDITDARREEQERRDLEAQLRRAQKLETIGTLAGGIAHDFNNILAPIVGYTDMAILSLRADDPVRADLVHVKNAADRARELVQQILLFSRRAEQDRVPVELPDVIDEALKLLRPSLPSTVTITRDIDRGCGRVLADATQLHQVIVNLCTNAWQVMEEAGGILGISLREVEIKAKSAGGTRPLAPGRYACLAVRDTGPGVDAAHIDRIFEPFFTTKGPDGGTGLGLSVVHGIVRGHGGEVQVDSDAGKGAEFRVLLPLADGPAGAPAAEEGDAEPGAGRVLVVDDEKDVAQLVCKMLRHFGYNAQYCTSGAEALRVLDDMADDCDLLISDLTMPGLTGVQLAEQARALRPGLAIVLMTGFGRDLTPEERARCGDCTVIAKPVTARTLTTAVKAAIVG